MKDEKSWSFSSFILHPCGAVARLALFSSAHNRYNPAREHAFSVRPPAMRVGIGHDTHRLVPGRPLRLGGVRIEHPRGLFGHSDADVVLHAVTDALLGAAGLGDIGDAYPDSDPAYKDCDSSVFLRETLARLNQAGWRLVKV